MRAGLAPLPESAAELRAVARRLGAAERDLKLGPAASETTVKGTDLSVYRVVYFATHGLVGGEIASLAEPALALTIPSEPSELDDGLLTAFFAISGNIVTQRASRRRNVRATRTKRFR